MTRRIVITIVVNVWLVLIAAGCSTYYITRSLLIADLDETIVSRVASLDFVERPVLLLRSSAPEDIDRFWVLDADGKSINPIMTSASNPPPSAPQPDVLSRTFDRVADGTLLRTLNVKVYHRADKMHSKAYPITVIYSASADHVEAYLNNLLYSLAFFAILAAVATWISAYSVARAALRPMRVAAAEVIGTIDERSLNRRIDVEKLPSELVAVGRRLNDMLGRLEIAFAHRRQFLADASHELRTPVAALVTTLEVALRRRRDADEYQQTLDRCLTDARVLHQLVVALLDQARAERYSRQPELGPVAVTSVLRECVRTVEPLARAQGLEMVCELPENLVILGDEAMIRSSVGNLLSNAVEYSGTKSPPEANGNGKKPAKIVRIGADTQRAARGIAELPAVVREAIPEGITGIPCKLRIAVTDQGPGVAAEHLAGIFEPFYRADAARAHPENHLGLGLALVRTQVRSLGGECRVTSPPPGQETGCMFTLEMPTLEISATAAKPVPRPVEEPAQAVRSA